MNYKWDANIVCGGEVLLLYSNRCIESSTHSMAYSIRHISYKVKKTSNFPLKLKVVWLICRRKFTKFITKIAIICPLYSDWIESEREKCQFMSIARWEWSLILHMGRGINCECVWVCLRVYKAKISSFPFCSRILLYRFDIIHWKQSKWMTMCKIHIFTHSSAAYRAHDRTWQIGVDVVAISRSLAIVQTLIYRQCFYFYCVHCLPHIMYTHQWMFGLY